MGPFSELFKVFWSEYFLAISLLTPFFRTFRTIPSWWTS
jgi:hypothetical protein